MPYAALVNGFAAHLLDYDDTFNPRRHHRAPAARRVAVVFALAESAPVTGRDALLPSSQASRRSAGWPGRGRRALRNRLARHRNRCHVALPPPWPDARVDACRAQSGAGSAGTQAAGLKAVYGTDGKPLHAGKAAMDGLCRR